jgi:nitrogen regulatory protein PII
MAHHLRVEVVTDAGHVDAVTRAIIDTAHCGSAGDGLIMVESLDSVLRVRSKCAPSADDL